MLVFVLLGLLPKGLSAHGDLDIRIAEATLQIGQWPDSAELYVHRATLYLQHEEFDKSIEDLQKSSDLGYADKLAHLLKAKAFHGAGQYNEALSAADLFLSEDPLNVVTLKEKASILFDSGEFKSSAQTYEKMMAHSSKTFPENHIQCANAWASLPDAQSQERARGVLIKGIERLGDVYVLQKRLITLHMDNGRYDQALEVQTKVIGNANRKETAFYEAALIFIEAKDLKKALIYLDNAELELSNLPNRIRFNEAMKELAQNIEEKRETIHILKNE